MKTARFLFLGIMFSVIMNGPPSHADVIGTLQATSGSVTKFQERIGCCMNFISGPGFGMGFDEHLNDTLVTSLTSSRATFGQSFNQTSTLFVSGLTGFTGGLGLCCSLNGSLDIVASPAPLIPGIEPHATVTSPFTATGILTAIPTIWTFANAGPFGGQYRFEGSGTMTTDFWPCTVTIGCIWNSTQWTFTAPGTATGPAVPEPSTWLLLASGLLFLAAVNAFRRRTRL